MTILVIAEHDNAVLNPNTLNTLAAANQIGGDIHLLVAGSDAGAAVSEAQAISGIAQVLSADHAGLADGLAENIGWLVKNLVADEANGYSHVLAPASNFGKNFMPRVAAMLDVMDSEYIKLARAKGVNATAVLWKHAFRNAIIAPLTFSSLVLAGFITGAIVTETVFSWPGLGRLAFTAVDDNDFPLIVGLMLLFTFMFLVVNLITDILYAYVDPRIRYG